jgi:hypothetical protein
MGNLISMYRNQEQWGRAVALGEKVLDVRNAVLGEWHPNTLVAMNALAWVYEIKRGGLKSQQNVYVLPTTLCAARSRTSE